MKIKIELETEQDKIDAADCLEMLENNRVDFELDSEGAPVTCGIIDCLRILVSGK